MFQQKIKIQEDKYYHVFNRGNNRTRIFLEPCNYLYFLKQFEKFVVDFADVYAYCLMPNHFHLFLRVHDKLLFEKGIKNFFISYSKSINKRYNRVGSLFQGRYKAVEVNSENDYTRIVTYIHQNPLNAGLSVDLEDYQYSSYKEYIDGIPSFLSKAEVFEWFGNLDNFIYEHQL
ncbi:MAG: transposase [Pedobacter sp.]|nr:MAG: transposase [Pedobacter sp.]